MRLKKQQVGDNSTQEFNHYSAMISFQARNKYVKEKSFVGLRNVKINIEIQFKICPIYLLSRAWHVMAGGFPL